MSKPSDLQMRECNVCVQCDYRVAMMCRRHDVPIRWSILRYGCGDFWPRDNMGVQG